MARKLPTVVQPATWSIPDIPALGQLVRNQRAIHAMRIDDAAALCGVSSNVLSRLENGKPVTLDKLLLVLNGLGLHMLVLPARQAHALKPALQALLPTQEEAT